MTATQNPRRREPGHPRPMNSAMRAVSFSQTGGARPRISKHGEMS
jgi:hypothetical protein